MKLKLKPRELQAIKYVDNCQDTLVKIKQFCRDEVDIRLEAIAGIDIDFTVCLNDCLLRKQIVVPIDSYIVKLGESDFTIVDNGTLFEWFNVLDYDYILEKGS